jgi:hypothetical protein
MYRVVEGLGEGKGVQYMYRVAEALVRTEMYQGVFQR